MITLDLTDYPLPRKFKRSGKECYLDPIRKKLIFITPEETIRQKVISYLINKLEVTEEAITIEEHLSHYGINSKRRADIIINQYNDKDNTISPLAVIECKATGVPLDEKATCQLFDYTDKLACEYCMLTDGNIAFCYKYDFVTNKYVEIDALPTYKNMLSGNYSIIENGDIPSRIRFEEIPNNIHTYQGYDIGESTEKTKAKVMINFLECLLDVNFTLPKRKYKMFTLIKDYGVRILSYGNASGGVFSGPYRSFLVDVNGSTEFVSISVSSYCTYAKPEINKTSLNVAIDNEKNSHHSLQLIVDDNMIVDNNKCSFYHHGKIAVGNMGSGRVNELRELINMKYPSIIYENKFFLGELTYDRLWRLNDEEMVELIENLISYALIRDEYRNYLKNKKNV